MLQRKVFQAIISLSVIFALSLGSVPLDQAFAARSDDPAQSEIIGRPQIGLAGVTETTAQIMQRAAKAAPPIVHVQPHFQADRSQRRDNPLAPTVAQWPLVAAPDRPVSPLSPQTVGLSFTGATLADTGSFPPDTMGTVGPTQFIVALNGRLRSFNKTTGGADGVLNTDMDTFFNSAMTPVVSPVVLNFTSDPRIRYDRLSGRWFIVMIDVPCTNATCTTTAVNRIMIAMSNTSTITAGTTWTFFYFNPDASNFTDYPTLGIDVNALYIGANMFTLAGAFNSTSGYVVRKSSLTGGGPIVWTPFTNLAASAGAGPFAPQGVDNYDPAATEGYFIGVDNATFSTLMIRRVSNPGGTPTISGNIALTVPTTTAPNPVPHLGNTGGNNGRLDSLDDRLYAAHIRNGRLWTAHNFRVSAAGVANTAASSRNAVRWYEIQNLNATPSLVQSGTIFDSAATNPLHRWIPSIMVSGQGHAAVGFSSAGSAAYADAATVGRLASDTLGTMQTPVTYTASTFAYNPPSDPGGTSGRRWGDYSYTSLDPCDDMTMWTIQEFTDATNSYGVRAVKLIAPPPATPSAASPATVPWGSSSVVVTITGSIVSGSGFYDTPSSLTDACRQRLTASVTGGVTVNSVTYVSPTSVQLDISTVGATGGAQNVTLTNPDGQSLTGNGLIQVAPPVTYTLITNTTGTGSGSIGLTPPGGVYTAGSVITVTASANSDSTFSGWSGDLSGSTNPTSLLIDSDKSITATFATACVNAITVANNADSGTGSLRQAIADICPNGLIDFDNDYTIGLETGQLVIDKSMTIDGTGHTIGIDGNSLSRVIYVNAGVTFNLRHVAVINGSALDGGGLYNNGATVILRDMQIGDNFASQYGGGLYNNGGWLSIDPTTIYSNSAAFDGGGLYNNGGTLVLTDTLFISNTADNNGGGLYASDSQIDALDSAWRGNAALAGGGGGLYLAGSSQLTLTHSGFYTNTAPTRYGGGLAYEGLVRIVNSGFYTNTAGDDGGGAIATLAEPGPSALTVLSSTLAGNLVTGWGQGGAIYNGNSTLVIQDSAFTDNSTTGVQGSAGSDGGGLIILNSDGAITNTTFSNNQATGNGGGLVYRNDGPLMLTHVTLAGNTADSTGANLGDGGGLYVFGFANSPLVLANTLIADNFDNSPASGAIYTDVLDFNAPASPLIQSLGYNLIGNATGISITPAAGDQLGDDLNPIDPQLATLANNGGPTPTRALLVGSPALDQIPNGTNSCGTDLTIDQRGFTRPNASTNQCDIGAYEMQDPPYACFARIDAGTTFSSMDAQAVRDAMAAAAATGDTVKVAGYCAGASGGQVVSIGKDITVRGGYTTTDWITSDLIANPTTLDALSGGRVVNIPGASNVTIENIILQNGSYGGNGGGLYNNGTLTVRNAVIRNNQVNGCAGCGGGGIASDGTLTVMDSSIYSNTIQAYGSTNGGGIMNYGTALISNTQVLSNTALCTDPFQGAAGGGVNNGGFGTVVTIVNSVVRGNSAQNSSGSRGGGLYNGGFSTLIVSDTLIEGNNARGGGGILNDNRLSIYDSIVRGNSVDIDGGGLYNEYNSADIVSTTFDLNYAGTRGGGIYNVSSGLVSLMDGAVTRNTAGNNGGGLYNDTYLNGDQRLIISGTHILTNTAAQDGGGIYNGNSLVITGSLISGNSAPTWWGGGLYNYGAATLERVSLQANSAASGGGIAQYNSAATLTLHNTSLITNTATNGGGLYNLWGNLTVDSVTVMSNTATSGGGLYFSNGTVAATGLSFIGNTATNGGGIYTSLSNDLAFNAITVTGNIATSLGGGFYNAYPGSVLIVSNSAITSNVASAGGGLYSAGNLTLQGDTLQNNGDGLHMAGSFFGASTLLITGTVIQDNATAGIVFGTGGVIYATVGGSPANANTFGNNGPGGLLNIDVQALNSNPNINALWNNWGVNPLPAIEDRISHRLDFPWLAQVDYYTLTVSATPSVQVADGVSPVFITTTLDGWLSPVAGDVINFATGLGTLGNPTATTDGSFQAYDVLTSTQAGTAYITATTAFDTIEGRAAYTNVLFSSPADLSIVKSVTPTVAQPGQAITYTLVVSNAGGQTASGVVITDIVPISLTGVTYQSAGINITATGGINQVWQVADLAPGASGIITITGVISPDIQGAAGFTNTATISALADGNPADNTSSAWVTLLYNLTVATVGNGTVTPTTSAYAYGTVVPITATAGIGSSFVGWSGDLSGNTNPTSILIDGNKFVTATFNLNTYTLTVATVGNGTVAPTTSSYAYGTVVSITATAGVGATFAGWSGDLSGSTNPTSILIDSDKSITATFITNAYTLTVATVGNGTVSPTTSVYAYGTVVPITATAGVGSSFIGWSGDLSGNTNPTSILIDGNKFVTATFSLNVYTLTVATAGNGTVSPTTSVYAYGTVVPIAATAGVGSAFVGWSGDLSGNTNPTSILIDGDKSITATFALNTYTLTVATVGNGTVSPTTSSYAYGTVVPITATANAGSFFTGWSGNLSGSTNPTSILIDGDKSITATFALNTYTLTVTTVGNGTVSPTTSSYAYGTVVPITATAGVGSAFSGWSGDLSGNTNPTSILIDGNKFVTATFALNAYTLTVATVGNGTVSPTTSSYAYGTVVPITATANIGSAFVGWSGDLSGSTNPTTILIDGNKFVTATFSLNTYTLTVATVGNGTVSPTTSSYAYGTVVPITSTANVGSSFVGWSGDLSGNTNPTSILIDGNKFVTATFEAAPSSFSVYLPLVVNNYMRLPDLIVQSITASSDVITVVIKNIGDGAATEAFWVDAYINPTPPPVAVNEIWWDLDRSHEGVAWGVSEPSVPIQPGEIITLTSNGDFVSPDRTFFPGNLPAGTPIYAQVDSYNGATNYGAVLEKHEYYHQSYNNILGPIYSIAGLTRTLDRIPSIGPQLIALPYRPVRP